jgi:uncharacterized protein YndB with AHSA1/START domain
MNDYARVEKGILLIERVLPGPIERVWSYLVDGEKRALWFAGGEFEQRAGGKGEFVFNHSRLSEEPTPEEWQSFEGFRNEIRCLCIEPPRLLVLGFTEGERTSELTFELTEQGDKVLLVLKQSPVLKPDDLSNYGSGWHTHLDTLQDQLEGVKPRAFWTNFAKRQKEYAGRG